MLMRQPVKVERKSEREVHDFDVHREAVKKLFSVRYRHRSMSQTSQNAHVFLSV